MKPRFQTVNSRGSALGAMLVAATLIGIFLGVWLVGFKRSQSSSKGIFQILNDEKLKQFITENINCLGSISPGGVNCTDGAWVTAYDVTGGVIAQGDSGSVKIGNAALRFRCETNPVLQMRVEVTNEGPSPEWRDLFGGVPFTCATPGPPPTPPCAVTNVTNTFTSAQISTALGLPANTWPFADAFHALMACSRLGYSYLTSYVATPVTALNCTGKTLATRRVANSNFQTMPACSSRGGYISSVTCREQRSVGCGSLCPPEQSLGAVHGPRHLMTSHFTNMAAGNLGNWRCLRIDGSIVGPPDCPGVSSDTPTRRKLCELLGYSTVKAITTDSYSSCSNNTVAKYNTATNSVNLVRACSSNSIIKTITCMTPITPNCPAF